MCTHKITPSHALCYIRNTHLTANVYVKVPDDEIPEWAQLASPTSHMIRRRPEDADGDKPAAMKLDADAPQANAELP